MVLADIKKLSKKKAKTNNRPTSPNKNVYGGVGGSQNTTLPGGGSSEGGGDGGGGGE